MAAMPEINGVEIIIDQHGRYSLNALHKASGGESAKRPGNWQRLDTTLDLIEEFNCTDLRADPIFSINGGKLRRTYAIKELALAYCHWISAPFYTKSLRKLVDPKPAALSGPVCRL